MLNLFFIILTFLFLVYKKILLLNEETLILLCFITFVYLSINSFGNSLKVSLDNQSTKIKVSLISSLNQLYTLFTHFSNIKSNLQVVLTKFISLGNYYYELVSLLTRSLPKFNNHRLFVAYTKRLVFLNKIEQQTIKLLPLIVIKKLSKIVKLKQFYNTSLKNNYFLCFNTISLREYIRLVSLKK
nr:ATP synthase B subunit precursor [Lithothamnion corallioides]